MNTIQLQTIINASIETVFDTSRSIDFHIQSASKTHEKAIAGKTTGLIGFGETVTWRGKHFGIFLKHTSKIVEYERPLKFTDIMIQGHFKYFTHQHFFRRENNTTIMTDILKYKVPHGIFGKLFNLFFLKKHLTKFLKKRNVSIKKATENHTVSILEMIL